MRNDDRSTFAERVLLPIVIAAGMVVAYLDLFIWRPL
jgi:hypothetical protein